MQFRLVDSVLFKERSFDAIHKIFQGAENMVFKSSP